MSTNYCSTVKQSVVIPSHHPTLCHSDTHKLVFPYATGPSNTTTLPESKQQVTNFIIQQTSIPHLSQLVSGALEYRNSWRCSLCVLFCEHSPFMVSSLQFAACRLFADMRLVLDVIYAPLTSDAAGFLFTDIA
jgi:hypothetical protein